MSPVRTAVRWEGGTGYRVQGIGSIEVGKEKVKMPPLNFLNLRTSTMRDKQFNEKDNIIIIIIEEHD